ncbi:hypothetical protein OGR47_05190 [Methylocystis sp. MJC1]|jgi:transposase|uniref:transposase n=1 Tax=Methylocystis sp. MJC1 TaxID=2654282 RepID=UPI0019CF5B0B|nr:transposase [Methylocystis sp. MJC1]KAF2988857.1 hypothetical protein MJC1_04074 [Methylocystis sp. MJC1]MBU6526402.1 hypothetical protein [Methylocystis sp. MJC1]UZX12848.1 hypothetical protein OGR47_05190 [Methylocystis sp. MJC1]
MAVDTLGHLPGLHVMSANVDDRAAVGTLAADVQEATVDSVEFIYVDQGYTGENAAKAHGVEICVVKLAEAKKGFVLLPKRWVVERPFAWATRFITRRRFLGGVSSSDISCARLPGRPI